MEKKGGKEFVEAVIELRKKNGPLDIAGGEALRFGTTWLHQPHICTLLAFLLSPGIAAGCTVICALQSYNAHIK